MKIFTFKAPEEVTGDLRVAQVICAILACVPPTLLAIYLPPSPVFLNQIASLVGWSLWLLVMTLTLPMRSWREACSDARILLLLLGLCIVVAIAGCFWARTPSSLVLSAVGMLLMTFVVTLAGAATQRAGQGETIFLSFCFGMALAGMLGALIGVVQIFIPSWTGNDLLAASTPRASGNLRQPNHLSSLLLWAMIAVVWLAQNQKLKRGPAAGLMAFMLFALVLTASRTGWLGVGLLVLWGGYDRQLHSDLRRLLWGLPVLLGLFWLAMMLWGDASGHVFAGDVQLHKADISSSRFAIWSNTLKLIEMHPWAGVGWGGFNFAWTLMPFSDRPIAFFDHTHNLELQFLVEFGLPLGLLAIALLLWGVWRSFCNARDAGISQASVQRTAFIMILMIGLHSQLEYPLWYAFFLLPAAFAFGICLGRVPGTMAASCVPRKTAWPLTIVCILMVAACAYVVRDYRSVSNIFSPLDLGPLDERIAVGQRSTFFGHHADYAEVTLRRHPSEAMPAFQRPTHFLLDTRLMMAWANALNESGDVDRARYLAARLREFRNPASDEFFAVCNEPRVEGKPVPFQCEAPQRAYSYRDFR